jgi:hypothetical protein
MTFAGFAYASTYEFEGEILSSAGGLPGNLIATTSATTFSDSALCCTAARTVKFTNAPKLQEGTQYFAAVAWPIRPVGEVGTWKIAIWQVVQSIIGTRLRNVSTTQAMEHIHAIIPARRLGTRRHTIRKQAQ